MKKLFSMMLACGLGMPVTSSFANQTTSTVSFMTPVDVQSCIITPILLNSYGSDSSPLSRAEAEALVQVLGSVRAIAAGTVELSVTRHGNNGSVNKAELSGTMGNSYLAAASVKSGASGWTWAEASADADVYAIASTAANASWDFRPLNFGDRIQIGTSDIHAGATFEAYAGVRGGSAGRGNAGSQAASEADSLSANQSSSSSETNSDVSSANEATSQVSVEAANIDKFEADLSMSGAVLHSINAKAIAEVLADAYARAYADALAQSSASAASTAAEFYAHLYAALYFHLHPFDETWTHTLVNWNPTWPFGQDYDSASAEARKTLRAEFSALAEAQAEAIVNFLASAQLNVNLGARFENLPGTEDLLEATGNSSATLTCNISQSLSAAASAQ